MIRLPASLERRLHAAAWFVRLPAMGTTFVILLLGVASGTRRADALTLLGLLGVGLAFHLFAYLTNDLRDLPIDRTDTRRADSPLIAGTVRPWLALALALAQLPLAAGLTAWMDASLRAWASLATAFGLMSIYNVWGKRGPFPPLTDLVQGLGWGALALYGSAISGRWTSLTGWVFGFVVVLIVMANGVHGSLRDILNDSRHGVRSTALLLGARSDAAGRLHFPSRLKIYGFTLQLILIAIVCAPLASNQVDYRPIARFWTLVAVLALGALALRLLHVAAGAEAIGDLRAIGTLQLIVTVMLAIALVAPSVDSLLLAIVIAGFIAPVLLFGWLPAAIRWGYRAALGPPTRLFRHLSALAATPRRRGSQ